MKKIRHFYKYLIGRLRRNHNYPNERPFSSLPGRSLIFLVFP